MFYLDNKSGSKTMPMPQDKVSDEPLWFVEDKDAPSYPGADWFNIVTLELINILKLGGVSPDKFKFNQIALVLAELMAAQSRIVASINEGLAKTADGEYFSVPQGWRAKTHLFTTETMMALQMLCQRWQERLRYRSCAMRFMISVLQSKSSNLCSLGSKPSLLPIVTAKQH